MRKTAFLSYSVYGGFSDAERNALFICPAQHQPLLPSITPIRVKWKGNVDAISHRDILGAVLALGLRRDQVGDIVMTGEGSAVIMVLDSKALFVCANLTQIGRNKVNCDMIEGEEFFASGDEGREIKGTVASLRIDAVLSLGFGIPRSRVVLLVKGGVVRANWRPVKSPSLQVREGDQISLKGKGRLRVAAIEGETRKGRIHIRLKKYS